MGKSIADAEYASILMGSLPESYTAILGSIAAAAELSGNTVSSAVVVKIATDEYDRRSIESGKGKDEAFAAGPQKKKRKKRNIECDNCHKKGHIKAHCWAKGGGDEGGGPKRKPKNSNKSNAAATSETPEIEAWPAIDKNDKGNIPRVPIIAAQGVTEIQSELYDSGASRHMSPFRKQFLTYKQIEARPITAANNKVFHAIGMGDL